MLLSQKPDLLSVNEKIKHAQQKIKKIRDSLSSAEKDKKAKEDALKSLENELTSVEKAATKQKGNTLLTAMQNLSDRPLFGRRAKTKFAEPWNCPHR
jgi:chromosome segregation ATPase